MSSKGHSYKGDIEGGQWIDAVNLSSGDKLLNADSSNSTVISVEIVDIAFQAFNLSVDDFHTYYVSAPGGSTAYWVHNACIAEIKARLKDPEKAKLLDGDLSDLDFQAAFDANPDLAKQWEKPGGPSNSHAIIRQDLNTLNMMDELEKSLPLPGNTKASSRAAATLADGTTIRSDITFGNLGQGLFSDPNAARLDLDKIYNSNNELVGVKINDREKYMEELRNQYLAKGEVLQPELESIIDDLIRSQPDKEYLPSAGLPGLHAEVRAVNDLLEGASEAGSSIADLNVSTLRPRTGIDFPACDNCRSIIVDRLGSQTPYNMNVLTGVVDPQ